ncbi:conserved hypothetical protein [delta proteobacterium NaphS2]|nr:conserved hypothetical protein [delta proteobacterium NaphS2]
MTKNRGQGPGARNQRVEGEIQRPSRRRSSSVACHLFLAFVMIFIIGCGRKGPPFIPAQKPFKAAIHQLRGNWKDESLALEGLIQGDKASLSRITGCRVYYVWYPLAAPPCEGCPVEMKNYRDVAGNIINDGQFQCLVPVFREKGVCFVMVRPMEKDGRLGPESNRIKLISDK